MTTKAAFAAWPAYKAKAEQTVRELAPSLPHGEPSVLDNPLVMLTFADGYLAGADAERKQSRALLARWLMNHLPCYAAEGCDLCIPTRTLLETAEAHHRKG